MIIYVSQLLSKLPTPPEPLAAPTTKFNFKIDAELASLPSTHNIAGPLKDFTPPTLEEISVHPIELTRCTHMGGEKEALKRLTEYMRDKKAVAEVSNGHIK